MVAPPPPPPTGRRSEVREKVDKVRGSNNTQGNNIIGSSSIVYSIVLIGYMQQ